MNAYERIWVDIGVYVCADIANMDRYEWILLVWVDMVGYDRH